MSIAKFCKIPCTYGDNTIEFSGTNAMDFLGKIYQDDTLERTSTLYQEYLTWVNWKPASKILQCVVLKTDPDAVIPSKSQASDVGYDLTVIKESKRWLKNITLYDTGLKIRVSHGYYAEIVPRSSLSKSGYMLANSLGIIDRSYSGNLLVALIKVDPKAPEIELPFRCCQIIFRAQHHMEMIQITESLDETARAEGGFGSTGV